MEKTLLMAGLGWLVPGLGHFLLGRKGRGALLALGALVLTVVGVWLGGLYYPGNPADFGVMYWLHQVAASGNGIFLFLNFLLKDSIQSGNAQNAFRSAYFEYGGRCLALAGLLNYLSLLDIIDLALKRKF